MPLDEYSRSWALRYLREAEVDLELARLSDGAERLRELSTLAMRKAQLAIQHALGQPEYLDTLVRETLAGRTDIADPAITLLARMRAIMRGVSDPQFQPQKDDVIKLTQVIVSAASRVVGELTGD